MAPASTKDCFLGFGGPLLYEVRSSRDCVRKAEGCFKSNLLCSCSKSPAEIRDFPSHLKGANLDFSDFGIKMDVLQRFRLRSH